MNSCVLMAKIINEPELRYTQENQMPLTQMVVEIEGLGPNDPPTTLRAVGWGNLASQIKETYSQGDQVILMGRLSMKTFERQEGFKEKRAELILSHIYPLSTSSIPTTPVSDSSPDNVVPLGSFKPTTQPQESNSPIEETPNDEKEFEPIDNPPEPNSEDLDDIPF